jgi:hypothetical protein
MTIDESSVCVGALARPRWLAVDDRSDLSSGLGLP